MAGKNRALQWLWCFGLAALLAVPALPAAAEDWYLIGFDKNQNRYYVDVSALGVEGGRVAAWQSVDFNEPQNIGADKPRAEQQLRRYVRDCATSREWFTSEYYRDGNGNVIDSHAWQPSQVRVFDVVPGTMDALILKFFCGRGRDLAARTGTRPGHMVSASAMQADWHAAGIAMDGQQLAIAADRIFPAKGGGGFYFLERRERITAQRLGLFKVKTSIWAGATDCTSKQVGYMGGAAFGEAGNLLYHFEMTDPAPSATTAETPGRTVVDAVCAQAVALMQPGQRPREAGGSTASASREAIGSGTAWYVDAGYFITAFHVIDGADQITLYGADRTPLKARIAAADAKNDIAILSVDFKDRKPRPLLLQKGGAALGQRVFTIGYPHSEVLGVSPKVTSGEVSGNLPLDPTHLLISVPIQAGNSGGPLLNMSGEVVGLVVEKLRADVMLKQTGDLTENTNFALKARYIDALLEDLPRLPTAPGPRPKAAPLEDLVAEYRDSIYFVLTHIPAGQKAAPAQ